MRTPVITTFTISVGQFVYKERFSVIEEDAEYISKFFLTVSFSHPQHSIHLEIYGE